MLDNPLSSDNRIYMKEEEEEDLNNNDALKTENTKFVINEESRLIQMGELGSTQRPTWF